MAAFKLLHCSSSLRLSLEFRWLSAVMLEFVKSNTERLSRSDSTVKQHNSFEHPFEKRFDHAMHQRSASTFFFTIDICGRDVHYTCELHFSRSIFHSYDDFISLWKFSFPKAKENGHWWINNHKHATLAKISAWNRSYQEVFLRTWHTEKGK
jgi:hypothetical protein